MAGIQNSPTLYYHLLHIKVILLSFLESYHHTSTNTSINYRQALIRSSDKIVLNSMEYKDWQQIISQIKNTIFKNIQTKHNTYYQDKLYFDVDVMQKYQQKRKILKKQLISNNTNMINMRSNKMNTKSLQNIRQPYTSNKYNIGTKSNNNKNQLPSMSQQRVLDNSQLNSIYKFYQVEQLISKPKSFNQNNKLTTSISTSQQQSIYQLQRLKHQLSLMITQLKHINQYPQSIQHKINIKQPFISCNKSKQQLKFKNHLALNFSDIINNNINSEYNDERKMENDKKVNLLRRSKNKRSNNNKSNNRKSQHKQKYYNNNNNNNTTHHNNNNNTMHHNNNTMHHNNNNMHQPYNQYQYANGQQQYTNRTQQYTNRTQQYGNPHIYNERMYTSPDLGNNNQENNSYIQNKYAQMYGKLLSQQNNINNINKITKSKRSINKNKNSSNSKILSSGMKLSRDKLINSNNNLSSSNLSRGNNLSRTKLSCMNSNNGNKCSRQFTQHCTSNSQLIVNNTTANTNTTLNSNNNNRKSKSKSKLIKPSSNTCLGISSSSTCIGMLSPRSQYNSNNANSNSSNRLKLATSTSRNKFNNCNQKINSYNYNQKPNNNNNNYNQKLANNNNNIKSSHKIKPSTNKRLLQTNKNKIISS